MKQMFDIFEKLIVGQSDEIYGVTTVNCVDSSWKHLSLIGDEEVISLSHAKVYVFPDSVLCLGKMHQNPLRLVGSTPLAASLSFLVCVGTVLRTSILATTRAALFALGAHDRRLARWSEMDSTLEIRTVLLSSFKRPRLAKCGLADVCRTRLQR